MRSELSIDVERKGQFPCSRSSSTFITFDGLEQGAIYWYGELPLESDLFEHYVRDAAWGSGGPIEYEDIAHVLIPKFFFQEFTTHSVNTETGESVVTWNSWEHEQDIRGLSKLLEDAGVIHRLTDQVLEVKRF